MPGVKCKHRVEGGIITKENIKITINFIAKRLTNWYDNECDQQRNKQISELHFCNQWQRQFVRLIKFVV